jgi:hypothetical protein
MNQLDALMTDTELVQAMKVIREYYGVGVTSEARRS